MEGKWTPDQLGSFDPAELRALGLELPASALWGADGAGLLAAVVDLEGCTAGFVSSEGLVITNHHCTFGAIQRNATPQRDLLASGLLAASRDQELPASGMRALVPHRSSDVTAELRAVAAAAGADDLERFRAVERRGKELVAACEATPSRRCKFATFDGGVRFVLYESLEYPDVRLVFAPPRAVGEFGGEVDNWSWPRHTGDFALVRVWANADGSPSPPGEGAAPYRPRHVIPVSTEGVAPGSFVMVAGFPTITYRSLTAAEMREKVEGWFPWRASVYRRWIDLMTAAAAGDPAGELAIADRQKTLANREKNARGQQAGIARSRHFEQRVTHEQAVVAWVQAELAAGRPGHAGALASRDELERLQVERDARFERDMLFDQVKAGAKPLDWAVTLVRWAGERAKPDALREPGYQDRDRERVIDRLRREQKALFLPAEQALLADWLGRAAALRSGHRVAAVDALLGEAGPAAAAERAAALLAGTRIGDLDSRLAMLEEPLAALAARADTLLAFALAIEPELLAWKDREDAWKGALIRLRPAWTAAVHAHAGRPVAPDANGTLRVSLAEVAGYAPREAVRYEPQTSVAGLVAKHTGETPFAVPGQLLAAAPTAPGSRFADRGLGNVPVAFLANADTTGGNSGSPVIDGRGRLVGVNFDRVWENVANDFGYDPAVARNVSADVRYLLWVLETMYGPRAAPLLAELGVR